MDEKNIILATARKEYTTILVNHLYPRLYEGMLNMWTDTVRHSKPADVYAAFQKRLQKVSHWNQDIIENEYQRILKVLKKKDDYLENLIKKVFVLNMHILAIDTPHHQKIKMTVPSGSKFVHHCYKECANVFWEHPKIMEDRAGRIRCDDQLNNKQEIYKFIKMCIETTIRMLLPIQSLFEEDLDTTPPVEIVNIENETLEHLVTNNSNNNSNSHSNNQQSQVLFDFDNAVFSAPAAATSTPTPPLDTSNNPPSFLPNTDSAPPGLFEEEWVSKEEEKKNERERENDNEPPVAAPKATDAISSEKKESDNGRVTKTIYFGAANKNPATDLLEDLSIEQPGTLKTAAPPVAPTPNRVMEIDLEVTDTGCEPSEKEFFSDIE